MSSIKFFCRAIDVEASLEGNSFIMPVIDLWCLWMESVVVVVVVVVVQCRQSCLSVVVVVVVVVVVSSVWS